MAFTAFGTQLVLVLDRLVRDPGHGTILQRFEAASVSTLCQVVVSLMVVGGDRC